VVDVHTFPPAELAATARRAGAVAVRVRTAELTAAWFGWPVRTFECAVAKGKLGTRWANFALRSWQRLSAVDRVLEHIVPKGLFYNAEITGLKP
ncbi:MAG: SAM-dependent methyltransferase, partial [Actinomycetota bacterium]|nr:SAM-dependent methyltransferase [Actinomycetota bacterium]